MKDITFFVYLLLAFLQSNKVCLAENYDTYSHHIVSTLILFLRKNSKIIFNEIKISFLFVRLFRHHVRLYERRLPAIEHTL